MNALLGIYLGLKNEIVENNIKYFIQRRVWYQTCPPILWRIDDVHVKYKLYRSRLLNGFRDQTVNCKCAVRSILFLCVWNNCKLSPKLDILINSERFSFVYFCLVVFILSFPARGRRSIPWLLAGRVEIFYPNRSHGGFISEVHFIWKSALIFNSVLLEQQLRKFALQLCCHSFAPFLAKNSACESNRTRAKSSTILSSRKSTTSCLGLALSRNVSHATVPEKL